jgi:AcrR family transcriptional regulator
MLLAGDVNRDMTSSPRPPGRPRDPAVRAAILAAARALLDEGGLTAVTMEGIARRAGVGKPTIYRHWPNSPAVAMAAFLETATTPSADEAHREPLDGLRAQLAALAVAFAERTGRSVRAMIAASLGETELAKAFQNQFIAASREAARELLERAIGAGQLRADLDVEVTLDLVYGPLYYRLLVGHAPLDRQFTDALLDQALRGLARQAPN